MVEAVTFTAVIQHRVLRAECPKVAARCGGPSPEEPVTGSFPDDVKAHIQYGDTFTVLAGLMDTFGAVSDSRNSEFIDSLFGVTLSPGTVKNLRARCAEKVEPLMERVRETIRGGELCNSDETGVRVNGKLMWVHNSYTPEYTFQTISERRGVDGIGENGVIPGFSGTVVHDCWGPYFTFGHVSHADCGAHLLRALAGIQDMEPCHVWPGHFVDLLINMKSAKEGAQADGLSGLSDDVLDRFSSRYDWVLDLADTECPPPPEPEVRRRGRRRKGRERSLIERLRQLKDAVCRFVHDFRVPFDNNQAERDLRGIKTKHKVSRCFRSREGARKYLMVTSFLNTARKNGVNVHQALASAFSGHADFIPNPSSGSA